MQQKFISLLQWPGGENEGGGTESENEQVKATDLQPGATEAPKEKKGFIDKIKDALKDWSNDDQQDQAIDDATP
jgi:hypothetical protein